MEAKKGDEKLKKSLLFVAMLLLIVLIPNAFASDIKIELDTDKNYYNAGEEIKFTSECYIGGIQVLSVPLELTVTDPMDNTKVVEMVGHTNGEYRGSFSPKMKGTYRAVATLNIRGETVNKTLEIEVISPQISMKIDVADEVEYNYGPVLLQGALEITERGKPLEKDVNIMIRSPSSPFYNKLCDVSCKGSCNFQCRIGRNIELSDYHIIAKTTHKGVEQIAKDKFAIVLKETEGLRVSFDNKNMFFDNETQLVSINATLNEKPLRDAMVNLKITSPDNTSETLLADEIVDGQYVKSYAGTKTGEYKVQATVAKGTVYGRFYTNYTVLRTDDIVEPFGERTAVETGTGRIWKTAKMNATQSEGMLLDISGFVSRNMNLSQVYLFGKKRVRLNITSTLLRIEKGTLDKLGNDILIEAGLRKTISPDKAEIIHLDHGLEYRITGNSSLYRLRVPSVVNRTAEFVFAGNKPQDNWLESEELIVYTDERHGIIYTSSTHNESLKITDAGVKNKKILQNDDIVVKPDFNNKTVNRSSISIFDSSGTILSNTTFNESFVYETDNETTPGKYFIILKAKGPTGDDVELSEILVLSTQPGIELFGNHSKRGKRNSEIEFEHQLKNNNFEDPDLVTLEYKSNFSTVEFYDAKGNKLTDTNKDGKIDTGKIKPGEEKKIIVKAKIPSDVSIGARDNIIITAVSTTDEKIKKTVTDELEVVAFTENQDEEYKNDLEILAIKDYDRQLLIKIMNHHNSSKVAKIQTQVNYTINDTFTHKINSERLIQPDSIQNVLIPKQKTEYKYLKAKSRLIGDDSSSYKDSDTSNNYKILISNDEWTIPGLNNRIPVPLRETLNRDHDKFTIRVYVDFKNNTPKHIIPVIFDKENHRTGNYKKLTFNDITNSGFMMLEFSDIGASTLNTAYIYFGNTEPNISYSNKDFEYETIINNDNARAAGRWVRDRQVPGYYGANYLHDLNSDKGWKTLSYYPKLSMDNYEIYAMYPSDEMFASRVPVLINNIESTEYLELNQQLNGGVWNYIGAYTLDKDSYVTLGNYGTEGVVAGDAFLFRKVSFYSSPLPIERQNGTIDRPRTREIVSENHTINANTKDVLEVNLNEYFDYITYISYNSTEGINVTFSDGTALVSTGGPGTEEVIFNNNMKNVRLVINITKINETIPDNSTVNLTNRTDSNKTINGTSNKSIRVINQRAVINKPVEWKLRVSGEELEKIRLPITAESLEVYDERNQKVNTSIVVNNRTVDKSKLDEIREKLQLERKLKNIEKQRERAGLFAKAAYFVREYNVKRQISSVQDELKGLGNISGRENATLQVAYKKTEYRVQYKTEAPIVQEA